MDSTDHLIKNSNGGHSRRRSSSLSPTEDPSIRPLKRRRTLPQLFGRKRDSLSESGDDCDRPLSIPSQPSPILSFFSFPKRKSAVALGKMPQRDEDVPMLDRPDEDTRQYCAPTPSRKSRRKSSLEKFKHIILGKRKDSGSQDLIFNRAPGGFGTYSYTGTAFDRSPDNEALYFHAGLEPLARDGSLHFQNVDAVERFDGPSDYYLRHRPCPSCKRVHSHPPYTCPTDPIEERPPTPMPDINIEAMPFTDHHGWRRSNNYNAIDTSRLLRIQPQKCTRRLWESFQDSYHEQSLPSAQKEEVCGLDRNVSNAQSIFSTRRFSNNPDPFGAGPDLSLRSINELGVLPMVESSSIETSSAVPFPTFAYPDPTSSTSAVCASSHSPGTQSSYPHSHTCSPSLALNLHPQPLAQPQCPPCPSMTPTYLVSPASGSFALPPPRFSRPEPPTPSYVQSDPGLHPGSRHAMLNPRLSAGNHVTALDSTNAAYWSQTTIASAAPTAIDNVSKHEGLGLRRVTNTLVGDALSFFQLNSSRNLGYNYAVPSNTPTRRNRRTRPFFRSRNET